MKLERIVRDKRDFLIAFLATGAIALSPVLADAHDTAKTAEATTQQSYGPSAPLGTGTVRTYVTLAKDKDELTNRKPPVAAGVEIPLGVLNNLPSEDIVRVIDFPIQARDTPFQYMMLDWNAHGHEPAGIYDKPHFDFHFYIQDLDEVQAIGPGPCSGLSCDAYQRANKPVPAGLAPSGYINVGSVVPFMGNHLIDPTSPEFNGQPFTRTWLYGAYDGQITFYEPMITLDSLTKTPNQCSTVKVAQQFARSAYYPTTYCTEFDRDHGMYRIYVKDFVYRVGATEGR